MTRSTRLLVGGLVIVAAIAAWFFLRSGGGDRVAIDLLAQFPTAKDKRPSPDVFEVVDATLAGTRRQAIFAKQASRVVWNVTIPDDAWLKVQVGLKEEAWTVKGDGLVRTYIFESFPDAIAFVTRLAFDAEAADHHPDLNVSYRKVTVTWSTHSEGGITDKDFEGTRQADAVASRLGFKA